MHFTAIHRALGRDPEPLTDELLDQAVAAGVQETHDLDWKRGLPAPKDIMQSDLPKDIAAMANSGGGMIVFGVAETDRKAMERHDVGTLDERHETTLRRAAVTAITPPVFGLEVIKLGESTRAAAIIVPPSVDGPHLVYKGEYFGAPIRNDSDTLWMRERDLEAAYRTRHDDRRRAAQALDDLYDEILVSRGVAMATEPWMICVARPRQSPVPRRRLERDQASAVWSVAKTATLMYSDSRFLHPLGFVDYHNPRAGLRRWVLPTAMEGDRSRDRESWASIHDDGAVTLAGAVSRPAPLGQPRQPWKVASVRVEAFVADFLSLVLAAAQHHGVDEYEVLMRIEWNQPQELVMVQTGHFDEVIGSPLTPGRHSKITATVRTFSTPRDYHAAIREIALDAVNQGGIRTLRCINPLPPEAVKEQSTL